MADGDSDAVKSNLESKIGSLIDAMNLLILSFADATSDERPSIIDEESANKREQEACRTRIEDIDAMKPCIRPDAAAEQALLDAMAAVSKLTGVTTSLNQVLKAADDLVRAYTAKSTLPTSSDIT